MRICTENAQPLGSPRAAAWGELAQQRLRGEHSDLLHLAVPGKHIGLTLILVFSDRCGKSTIASSAPGSAMALFPLRGERQVGAAIPPTRGEASAQVFPFFA